MYSLLSSLTMVSDYSYYLFIINRTRKEYTLYLTDQEISFDIKNIIKNNNFCWKYGDDIIVKDYDTMIWCMKNNMYIYYNFLENILHENKTNKTNNKLQNVNEDLCSDYFTYYPR